MNNFVKILGYVTLMVTSTQTYCQDDNKEIVNSIIQLTYNADYDSAGKRINELKNGAENTLQLNYFKAMIIWRQHLVLGSAVPQKEKTKSDFEEKLNFVISEGESILQKNEKDSTALFFTGAAYGYLAQYYSRVNENYFKAASFGKVGLDLHEKLLLFYPKTYDVYYSLGLFNYLASNVPWYLKPVLFILGRSGSEAKAYKYLKTASIKGNFARFEAMETLAELYTENEKYNSADSLYKELKIQFSNNTYYYYFTYLKQLFSSGADPQFFKVSDEALKQSKSEHKFDYSQKLYVALIFATLSLKYENQGKIKNAIDVYSEFLGRKIDDIEMNCSFLFSRGKLFESTGKISNAIKDYETVIKTTKSQSFRNTIQMRLNSLIKK
ncbi:MAG: hypothetical protein WC557_05330 [Ignavibacteriaceae bacterium]